MKRYNVTCIMIISIIIPTIIGITKMLWAQTPCVTVYTSRIVADHSTVQLDGVNVAEYGFQRVDQYVITAQGDLFIVGDASVEGSSKLSVVFSNSHHTVLITKELGWPSRPDDIRLMVFYLHDRSDAFILVEYADVNVSKTTEEGVTYLDLFRVTSPEEIVRLQHDVLTETMIYKDWDADAEYTYTDFSDEGGGNVPAKKERMKYFLSDANHDGYADILLWKGRFLARGKHDSGHGDFFLDREELDVMYFEPDTSSFSTITSIEAHQSLGDHEILAR